MIIVGFCGFILQNVIIGNGRGQKNGRHEIVTTCLFEGLFLKRKMCRSEKVLAQTQNLSDLEFACGFDAVEAAYLFYTHSVFNCDFAETVAFAHTIG